MSKRESTKYPYHVDPYKKHRITDEELDFLQELQKTVDLSMLVSPYAILLDGESGSVLASKKGDEKIFPAARQTISTRRNKMISSCRFLRRLICISVLRIALIPNSRHPHRFHK